MLVGNKVLCIKSESGITKGKKYTILNYYPANKLSVYNFASVLDNEMITDTDDVIVIENDEDEKHIYNATFFVDVKGLREKKLKRILK